MERIGFDKTVGERSEGFVPEKKKNGWRQRGEDLLAFYRSPGVFMAHFLGALIAWFAPLDVLQRFPELRAYTQAVNEVFPIVGNYAGKSRFPEVTELYFAVMVLFAPLYLRFYKIEATEERMKAMEDKRKKMGWKYLALVLIFLIFVWPACFLMGLFFSPGDDFFVAPINTSRLALGLAGPMYAGGAAFVMLVLMALFIKLLSRK